MKKAAGCFVLLLLLFGLEQRARAVTLRYALIVGNNVGVESTGREPYPPLRFAEKEALRLRNKLVSLSNFDGESGRTRLLVGATRKQLKEAFRVLVRQKEKDERALGETESLFLFYFTGHGIEGKLLLEDGPLSAHELGALFRSVDADFSVAVFDACFSGSFEKEALSTKGLLPTPGLNLFRELPEEMLSAEGSIWFVSSGQGQASYEDERIGGVFTHFFIEALERASKDGPGITLDRIWHYARKHTVEYTARRDRRQVPEQFISRLKASEPIYFSFPLERSATLVFSESLKGLFVLSYADGYLSELVHKERGKAKKVAVFPGAARLMRIDGGRAHAVKALNLSKGREIVLSHLQGESPPSSVGERTVELWEKGIGLDKPLKASTIQSGVSMLGGLSYGYAISSAQVLLPQHEFDLATRFDYAKVVFSLGLGYGLDTRRFDAWHYRAHAMLVRGHVGYSLDVGTWRFSLSVSFQLAHIWQRFSGGTERRAFAYRPALRLDCLYPTPKRFLLALFVQGGPTWSPTVNDNSKTVLYFSGGVGLALYFRLI